MSRLLLLGCGGKGGAGGGGGGGFAPDDLGSLLAWYDGSLLTGSDGDGKSTWADSSGNGWDLTSGGGPPTLDVAELNGMNVVRFTAASNQWYGAGATINSGLSSASFHMVYKVVSDTANNAWAELSNSGSAEHLNYINGLSYCSFGTTVRKDGITPSVSYQSWRIISFHTDSGDWRMYVDGGSGGSSGGTSPLYSTGTNTVGWFAGMIIGKGALGSGNLDGWIAEIIRTDSIDSTGDRQSIEGYLAHKWGLTGNLSGSHPYKSTPP